MNVTFLLLAFAEICKAINYMKVRSAKTRNAARRFKIHPLRQLAPLGHPIHLKHRTRV